MEKNKKENEGFRCWRQIKQENKKEKNPGSGGKKIKKIGIQVMEKKVLKREEKKGRIQLLVEKN